MSGSATNKIFITSYFFNGLMGNPGWSKRDSSSGHRYCNIYYIASRVTAIESLEENSLVNCRQGKLNCWKCYWKMKFKYIYISQSFCNNFRRTLKITCPHWNRTSKSIAEFVFDLPQSIKNLSKLRFIDPWVRNWREIQVTCKIDKSELYKKNKNRGFK